MIKSLLAVLTLAVAFASAARAQEPPRYDDLQMLALEHGGTRRSVGLYTPASYSADRPAPVIVALHGRFSSAKAFHAISGLAAIADARGAIIVYPETLGGFWNDGGFAALGRRETPADDTGFIEAAVAAVRAQYAVDGERLFLIGYDTGGSLVYRLTCDGPLRTAGIAIVSAQLWDYAEGPCAGAASPMLILHGRRDDLVPVRGGSPGAPIEARRLSVAQTIARWRNQWLRWRAERKRAR